MDLADLLWTGDDAEDCQDNSSSLGTISMKVCNLIRQFLVQLRCAGQEDYLVLVRYAMLASEVMLELS